VYCLTNLFFSEKQLILEYMDVLDRREVSERELSKTSTNISSKHSVFDDAQSIRS
jgi:hypothetical protein